MPAAGSLEMATTWEQLEERYAALGGCGPLPRYLEDGMEELADVAFVVPVVHAHDETARLPVHSQIVSRKSPVLRDMFAAVAKVRAAAAPPPSSSPSPGAAPRRTRPHTPHPTRRGARRRPSPRSCRSRTRTCGPC